MLFLEGKGGDVTCEQPQKYIRSYENFKTL